MPRLLTIDNKYTHVITSRRSFLVLKRSRNDLSHRFIIVMKPGFITAPRRPGNNPNIEFSETNLRLRRLIRIFSANKVMTTVVRGVHGIIHVDTLKRAKAIGIGVSTIKEKYPSLADKKILLHQDFACVNT